MASLATLPELENRLDWTLDAQEKVVAQAALDDASVLVQTVGLAWTESNAPPIVKSIVLSMARRLMVNVQGLTISRAGDEQLSWSDVGDKAGAVYLTADERRLITGIARGAQGLVSVGTYAWGTTRSPSRIGTAYVPVEGNGKPFPFFASEEDDW